MTSQSTPRLKLKAQIYLGDRIAIGPGKADLLAAVDKTGSIAAAGRSLGISYRRTRDLIDTLNQCWGEPVVIAEKGGMKGGGSELSRRGREVLDAYRELEQALHETAAMHSPALVGFLGPVDERG